MKTTLLTAALILTAATASAVTPQRYEWIGDTPRVGTISVDAGFLEFQPQAEIEFDVNYGQLRLYRFQQYADDLFVDIVGDDLHVQNLNVFGTGIWGGPVTLELTPTHQPDIWRSESFDLHRLGRIHAEGTLINHGDMIDFEGQKGLRDVALSDNYFEVNLSEFDSGGPVPIKVWRSGMHAGAHHSPFVEIQPGIDLNIVRFNVFAYTDDPDIWMDAVRIVPEPATLLLLGSGLCGLTVIRYRR